MASAVQGMGRLGEDVMGGLPESGRVGGGERLLGSRGCKSRSRDASMRSDFPCGPILVT